MQALWSRAAQIKSCRCKACLHTATALTRRTARAGSKRRLNINDLFKAKCYSTIIGTAVFMDAKAKDERRKAWDKAIGEAKAELSESSAFEKPVDTIEDTGKTSSNNWPFSIPIPPLHKPAVESPALVRNTAKTPSRLSPLEAQLKLLDTHVKQSLETCNQNTAAINGWSKDDDDVWQDLQDFRDVLPTREPKTQVHIEKMQEMIAKLVARLLLSTKAFCPKPGSVQEGDADVAHMAKNINELRSLHTPLPKFTVTDWSNIEQVRSELNSSIETIFQKAAATKKPNVELVLAKICYNLLICNAPPGVETYDLLLRYLTELGQHKWALIVASSFMEDSRYRPSFNTMQYMLEAYTADNNLPLFRTLIQTMRGIEDGLRTRRRKVKDLKLTVVMNWAKSSAVMHRNNMLYEKAPRNEAVFDALIRGTLKLQGVRPTLKYIRAALRQGNRLRSDTLAEIIQGLLKQRDYLSAVSLLRTISNPWSPSAPRDEDIGTLGLEHNAQTRRAVYTLLSMCGIDASLPLASQIQPHEYMPVRVERLLSDLLYGSLDLFTDESTGIPRFENALELVQTDLGDQDDVSPDSPEDLRNSSKSISPGYCSDAATILTESLQENAVDTGKEAFMSSNRIILLETLTDRLVNLSFDISDIYKNCLRLTYFQLSGERQGEYFHAAKASPTFASVPARLSLAIRLYLKERHVKQIKSAEARLIQSFAPEVSKPETGLRETIEGETIPNMASSGFHGEICESRVMDATAFPQVLEAPAPTPDVEEAKYGQIGQVVVRPILIVNSPAARSRQRLAQLEKLRLVQSSAETSFKIMPGRPDASVLPPVKTWPGSEVPQPVVGQPATADAEMLRNAEDIECTDAWLPLPARERRHDSTAATG